MNVFLMLVFGLSGGLLILISLIYAKLLDLAMLRATGMSPWEKTVVLLRAVVCLILGGILLYVATLFVPDE